MASMDQPHRRRVQFGLRTLFLAFVPVAIIALPAGYYLRRPVPAQPVPVSGTVMLDGVSLDGADVTFHSTAETGCPAWARSDVNGRFALKCWHRKPTELGEPPKSGAMSGSYLVIIQKREAIRPRVTRPVTPERYASAVTSGLTAKVTRDGPNVFAFNLTTP